MRQPETRRGGIPMGALRLHIAVTVAQALADGAQPDGVADAVLKAVQPELDRGRQAEATVERVRALAQHLASDAPADDWGESMSATIGADIGRAVLAALDQPAKEGE